MTHPHLAQRAIVAYIILKLIACQNLNLLRLQLCAYVFLISYGFFFPRFFPFPSVSATSNKNKICSIFPSIKSCFFYEATTFLQPIMYLDSDSDYWNINDRQDEYCKERRLPLVICLIEKTLVLLLRLCA